MSFHQLALWATLTNQFLRWALCGLVLMGSQTPEVTASWRLLIPRSSQIFHGSGVGCLQEPSCMHTENSSTTHEFYQEKFYVPKTSCDMLKRKWFLVCTTFVRCFLNHGLQVEDSICVMSRKIIYSLSLLYYWGQQSRVKQPLKINI